MIALLHYIHTYFIRSYRYAAPSFIYLAGIGFIYSIVPNPVMPSYSFSSSFLFIIAIVLGAIMLDLEAKNNEWITAVHARHTTKLYAAKILYSWLFTIPLALFAVIYPILFHKFNRDPFISEIMMSTLYHLSLSFLGVTLAVWFNSKLVASRAWSFLSLTLIVVLSLSGKGIEEWIPEGWRGATIVLPPLYRTMEIAMAYENQTVANKIAGILFPLIYGCVSAVCFLLLMKKRKFEPPRQ